MMKNHDIEQMENHGESHYHKKTREPVELFMPTQKTKIMDWQNYQYSRIIVASTVQVSESVRKSWQL